MFDLGKLNVCFIALTLGKGGAEQQFYHIIKTLVEKGTTVRVLALTQGEFWESKINALGVPVIWVGQSNSRLLRLIRIIQILRNNPPDFIQSMSFHTNFYTTLSARLIGSHEICAVRCDGFTELNNSGRIDGFLNLKIPRYIAVNSNNAIRNLRKLGIPSNRLFYLPNVVDSQHFNQSISREFSAFALTSAGRLIPRKRFDRFLSLSSKVKQRSKVPISLFIVGNGPELENLIIQAKQLGLPPDILKFLNQIPDTAPIYGMTDIFILTSEAEGTPNVILEAMSCENVVISSSVGDIPEIIQNGKNGYLLESFSENELINLILELINNSHKRDSIGRDARQFIIDNYSLERLPNMLSQLYEQRLNLY